MNNKLRILLADDHVIFRRGVAAVLAAHPGMEVVGEAADGFEAISLARALKPDVVLMDIGMPHCNGLEATRQIKREYAGIRVVMLTVSDTDQDLFEAIKGGAQGYLIKDLRVPILFEMLEGVARGEAAFSDIIATKILQDFIRPARDLSAQATEATPLTTRERVILEMVADGQSNKEIARALSLAESTVKSHLRNVLEKLHLRNRVQAAVYAVRQNMQDGTSQKDRTARLTEHFWQQEAAAAHHLFACVPPFPNPRSGPMSLKNWGPSSFGSFKSIRSVLVAARGP